MRVVSLPDAEPRPRTVAVGMFDGVHLGHREVIAGADTVLTFDPHPLAIVEARAAPPLLTTLAVKAERIADLGVSELVVIPFDEHFARQAPSAFIDEVLLEALRAQHVSVGENFRFGHQATGTPALLEAREELVTRVVPIVELQGESISSTRIRELVATGGVAKAGALLGTPFELRGTVLAGDGRGRDLGYPTANLEPDPALALPAFGIYAGLAGDHAAAVSIGVRPTFETGGRPLVEAHLLDYDGDLYGCELRVRFLERLRGEERFDSADALVARMREDVERTRQVAKRAREAGHRSATLRRR